MTRCRDTAIQNFPRWRYLAAILDLVQPKVAPFDPKPYPRTKCGEDPTTRCRDMAIRNFPRCEVGRRLVVNVYIHTDVIYFPLPFRSWLRSADNDGMTITYSDCTLWSAQFPHHGTSDLEHVATSYQEQ